MRKEKGRKEKKGVKGRKENLSSITLEEINGRKENGRKEKKGGRKRKRGKREEAKCVIRHTWRN